jgi:hypothetical protein
MASGLLVAGTGAALALADTESDSTGTSGPASDPAASATPGVTLPGGLFPGLGGLPGGAKPSSSVGDGRNGVTSGASTRPTTATASESATEAAPTTEVTETSSKPAETGTAAPEPTESGVSSEQSSGVTTRVSEDPTTIGAKLPALVEEVPLAAGEDVESTFSTTSTSAPPEETGYGWPWSWWNWYPQAPSGGGGGSTGMQLTWQSLVPPTMQIPQIPTIPRELVPQVPGLSFDPLVDAVNGVVTGVNGAVTGLATAASALPFTQITLPVVVIPGGTPANAGGGGVNRDAGGPGVLPHPGIASAPKPPMSVQGGSSTPASEPQPQQPSSEPSDDTEALSAPSYRMGYVEYLRAAGFSQVAAVAVPGFTGILILTGAGGLIGYRQARAGRSVRAGATARFMG